MTHLLRNGILAVLVLIFSFSAIDKIFHFDGFLLALENYVILPGGLSFPVGIVVIAVEILIAIGLSVRRSRRFAALLTAVTLSIFLIAIGANYIYGDAGICGCWFTITLAKGTGAHLVFNFALLVMALTVWWEELVAGRSIDMAGASAASSPVEGAA